MAEAHGYFGAYDYSLFTFGIKEEAVKRPKNYFVADNFTPEEDLAEHFEIDVSEEILAFAESKSTFFLPDLDVLRFIDAGDTLTLRCGEKTAEFKITEIGRSPAEEGEPYKIDTKYKINVRYTREDPKIALRIPAPTAESTMLSALLNGMASEYASILGENYRTRKAEFFEKSRALAEKLHGEGKITLYAGDCAFSDFSFAISAESGHFTAVNVFCTDSENFYIMGVCRDSTPLFRKLCNDEVNKQAENRWGGMGTYFEEQI
jgi:ribosomal 50S subunit-recycling heat shock protein